MVQNKEGIMSLKKTPRKLELFTNSGIKSIRILALIIIAGISFLFIKNSLLQEKCDKNSDHGTSSLIKIECLFYPYIGEIGLAFIQAVITIIFFEFALKKASLEEVQDIFKVSQAIQYIDNFYDQRSDYNHLIEDSLKSAVPQQEIKFITLSEELTLLSEDNIRSIANKVIDGCHIQALLIHPDSCLIHCLERSGFTHHLSRATLEVLAIKFFKLSQWLKFEEDIKGSLEIRLHKDLFSPIGYYSDSQNTQIIWLYFSDRKNKNEYPAFHMANNDNKLIEFTENHFNSLWQRTEVKNILLRFGRTKTNSIKIIDNIQEIFNLSFTSSPSRIFNERNNFHSNKTEEINEIDKDYNGMDY